MCRLTRNPDNSSPAACRSLKLGRRCCWPRTSPRELPDRSAGPRGTQPARRAVGADQPDADRHPVRVVNLQTLRTVPANELLKLPADSLTGLVAFSTPIRVRTLAGTRIVEGPQRRGASRSKILCTRSFGLFTGTRTAKYHQLADRLLRCGE